MIAALLPAFVGRLLDQGRDPGEIPEISVSMTTGWLAPLATRVLSLLDTWEPLKDDGVFLAHGYFYLPLSADAGRATYLRVAAHSTMTPWPVSSTSVVLTLAGTVALEMYQDTSDQDAGRPQYARSFGPEQLFAAHPGTLCATEGSRDCVQVLVSLRPEARLGSPITSDDGVAAARRARWTLESLAHRNGR